MRKMTLIPLITGILVASIGFNDLLRADGMDEELLFMEIPMVIASSKREQPLTEAASSMAVVTASEIKASGATNVGDVLRFIAGIDIRESHTSQHVIGIRGFCDTSHVLVTIDGNNVFMYHANHIFLDWAPLGLEEIDRIEIIKGPGAIFYGGNAFSGVINIVTKTPEQLEGTQVNAAGGNWDTIRTNIIHAGSCGNLDYSLTGGHRGAEEWEAPKIEQERDSFSVDYFGGRLIYHPDDESSFSLDSRYSDAENVISRVCSPETTFVSVRHDRPGFWIRYFHNNHEKTFWNDTYSVNDTNRELEFLCTRSRGQNITSFGGYTKLTAWEVGGLKGENEGKTEKHSVEDYAINIENEYHASDRLIFTLGGRCEYYSLLDYLALGRGSIIYKHGENQSTRFTIANGYYIPSLFQQTNEGTVYPFALGNRSLKEEKITSYELSHYNRLTDRAKLNISLFYNDYRDLIDNTQAGPTKNITDAYQYGGELELDFALTSRVTGFANYSYQHIHRDDFGNLHVDPENKFNCGLRASAGSWSWNTAFRYVDEYYETYLTSNPVFGRVKAGPSKVDSYVVVDACIAYRVNNNLELAIAAYNLFENKHYESNPDGWHTGDKVGRRITVSGSYKF